MENPIPPEERAAAFDVPPAPMEPARACEIRERIWLETNYMIGPVEENAERYKRFMEENPIITTKRYPPTLNDTKKLFEL